MENLQNNVQTSFTIAISTEMFSKYFLIKFPTRKTTTETCSAIRLLYRITQRVASSSAGT